MLYLKPSLHNWLICLFRSFVKKLPRCSLYAGNISTHLAACTEWSIQLLKALKSEGHFGKPDTVPLSCVPGHKVGYCCQGY